MFARKSKIGEQLCFVYRGELLDCFYFDDHRIFNDQVHAITTIEVYFLVYDRQCFLFFHFEPELPKLKSKACLVSRFEQPGTEPAMDLNGRADYAATNEIEFCFFIQKSSRRSRRTRR